MTVSKHFSTNFLSKKHTIIAAAIALLLLVPAAFAIPTSSIDSFTKKHHEQQQERQQQEYSNSNNVTHNQHHNGVKVASFKWEYVKAEFILTMFILVIGLFKLLYHQFEYPQALVPESCCLIVVGTLLGFFFYFTGMSAEILFLQFDQKVFFFILLPPIILEAAYSLNDCAFIENLGTILLYAVLGTVLNIAIIGGLLVLAARSELFGNFNISILDSLLFASLIAAVDPVAVLAIFKEVGVNKMLYFMVFGESLLNDAVTVVCYNLVKEFKELATITAYDCFLGLLAFLCVSFGGLFIGTAFGIFSSLITRYTIHVRVVEPVICFTIAYLAYVCSELFHFSGIIGIIACGLIQVHYTMHNLSAKSQISINYTIKVVSNVSESLIFIILGVMLANKRFWFREGWNLMFSFCSLFFCILARFIVVFLLTYIVNFMTGGVRYISLHEQVIMAYGGLRGAVSFSLAFMLPDTVAPKWALLSATYVVILATVFIQGCTIKALVNCLNIRLAKLEDNFRLFNAFNRKMINHLSQGIEDIIGVNNNTVMKWLRDFSEKHIRPLLQRDYMMVQPEDVLVMIESEESFKESLRTNASKATILQQNAAVAIDALTEEVPSRVDLLDEECQKLHIGSKKKGTKKKEARRRSRKEQMDWEVDELTGNTMQIQSLFQGHDTTAYPDRNLVDEGRKELEAIRTGKAASLYNDHLQRIACMRDITETRQGRPKLFGAQRRSSERRKMSVTKGMLAVSAPSMGVSSGGGTDAEKKQQQPVVTFDIDRVKGEEEEEKADNEAAAANEEKLLTHVRV